jgi:P27 family predicted phage terminase small subunit
MAGRRPKPTKLKVLAGNPGRRPLNPDEPIPETAIPSPPDFLNPDALQEWGRMSEKLYQLGMLAEIDRGLFANYCQAYGRWAETERQLKKTSTIIKTKNDNIIQSPLVGIANKAAKEMRDAASLMGIPATMRSKVHALGTGEGKKKKTGFGGL